MLACVALSLIEQALKQQDSFILILPELSAIPPKPITHHFIF